MGAPGSLLSSCPSKRRTRPVSTSKSWRPPVTADCTWPRGVATRPRAVDPSGMRDPDRIDPVLEAIRSRWSANPDSRLGQLIVNAVLENSPFAAPMPELFYMEDEELAQALGRAEP